MARINPHRRLADLGASALSDWRGVTEPRKVAANQRSVSELLPKVLETLGLRQRCLQEDMTAAWQEIVGELAGAHSKPVALNKGVLTVTVSQPAIHWTLNERKRDVVTRLNERFGAGAVRSIRFTVG